MSCQIQVGAAKRAGLGQTSGLEMASQALPLLQKGGTGLG